MVVGLVSDPKVIVDLCTGSGNLALALKHTWPGAQVIGTDLSSDAVALARENAEATELDVTFLEGDLFEPLPPELHGAIDLLVANPPYVSEQAFAALPLDVRGHDPYEALVAGPTGTETIARLASHGPAWLAVGGVMAFEISEDQAVATQELCAPLAVEIRQDLAGRDRFAIVSV